MTDIPILEHAMAVILTANPMDKEAIKRAQDKVLDALVAAHDEGVRQRQSPDYDGREP